VRILVVTDEWFPETVGGVSRVASETARLLAARGHEITVLAPKAPRLPADELDSGVRVRRLLQRRRGIPRTLTDVLSVMRIAKRVDPADVVIAHQVTTAAGAILGQKAPVVFVYHASPVREAAQRGGRAHALRPLLAALERLAAERAARIVALSRYSRSLLVSDRPGAKAKVSVISGGVDIDSFHPADGRQAARRRLGVDADRRLVVAVRRLDATLGLENVVDTLEFLPDVELVLVGHGRLAGELRQRAAKIGAAGRLRLVDAANQEELRDWYRAADVCVQSPAPHEGFGLAMIEALASGTPALGAAVGAVPETLAPLSPLLVAASAAAADLAAAIDAVTPELKEHARDYAVRKYAWPAVIDAWETVLEETVAAAAPAATPGERVVLAGAPVDPVTLAQCVALVDRAVAERKHLLHTAVNAAKVVRVQNDPALRAALWSADLSTADGQAVVWAARALGRPLPERVAGIDLMERLLAHAASRHYSVYLLGARPDVVAAAADAIRDRHPMIKIAGYRDGYFDPHDDASVAAEVAATKPDLVFVGLETPRKELFLAQRAADLGAPFAMGVGGAFDVLAGRTNRAPKWAQRLGLEWAFRLAQEPRRLGRRYVTGNAQFVALMLREFARARHR
jgi:N-acetylglucosaminyldiphosphoundecaprenol N-acetyl-beta-D-mannosaminyltransferase